MTKEQFIAIGMTEEQAAKAAEESAKELAGYVPKHRFDEVNTENKNLKDTAKKSEEAMEELKKANGNSEELQKQIQKLQDDAKEAEAKFQGELKDTRLMNAIKLAISEKTHDADLVAGLFDKSKLILGDDGKVTGIDEQLKTLKEGKAYLFKEEKKEEEGKPGFYKVGGNPPETKEPGGSVSLKDAIAAHYQK